MSLLVPFDGTELSEAALVRAMEFGHAFEEDVLVISVIPKNNTSYARERGWLDEDEQFDLQPIVSRLQQRVVDIAPTADFRHVVVDRYATAGTIASRIRKLARKESASMIFIGSENAGRVVSAVSSVGRAVATDRSYDVVIVRNREPAKIAKLAETSELSGERSDFSPPIDSE